MGRSKGRSGVRDRDGPGAICMQNIETVTRGWGMVIKTPNLDNRSLPRSAIGEGNGTHSGTLAWKIPWTEEPGGLQSMGSRRVGHD